MTERGASLSKSAAQAAPAAGRPFLMRAKISLPSLLLSEEGEGEAGEEAAAGDAAGVCLVMGAA